MNQRHLSDSGSWPTWLILAEESVTADGASQQRRIEIIRTVIDGQSREEALTELYKAAKSHMGATRLAISVSLNRFSPAELGDLMVRHSEAGTSPCAQAITHMAAPDGAAVCWPRNCNDCQGQLASERAEGTCQ